MDTRRVGHAQRRRAGAPANVYDTTMKPPAYGPGDPVRAQGRYGIQEVATVIPAFQRPSADHDGHAYIVRGGKGGRTTMHTSDQLRPANPGPPTLTGVGRWSDGQVTL